METDSSFGRVLMEHRKRRGMSRSQLSDAAKLSYPYVSQLETGLRKPSRSAAARLAAALGLDPLDLEAAIPVSGDNREVLRASTASLRLLTSLDEAQDRRPRSAQPLMERLDVADPDARRDDLIGQLVDLLEEFDASDRLDVLAEVQKLAMRRLIDQESSRRS